MERPADFPPPQDVEAYFEPTAHVSIMAPADFLSPLMALLTERRGVQEDVIFLNSGSSAQESSRALLAALPSVGAASAAPDAAAAAAPAEAEEEHADEAEAKVSADADEEEEDGEDAEDAEEEEEEEEEAAASVTAVPSSRGAPLPAAAASSRHQHLAITSDRVVLKFRLPWAEVVSQLADQVKSMTAGYASLDWLPGAYVRAEIVKVDLMLNSKPVDALSFVCHRDKALAEARR